MGCYLFGTVLAGLHVGFPLGVFLLMVMFGFLLLKLLVMWWCRGMNRLFVLSCLAWWVVLECSVVGEFLGALKEFDFTEKLQHTLQDMAGMGFSVSAKGLEETESCWGSQVSSRWC